MSPVVSIIIDNYNYARFLMQAIDSALAQTYAHIEVVVVDDGSTDESADIIRSYGERVRAIFKENGGQASAMNAGFAQSSGDIIAFLDADDYLGPTAAEQLVAHWKEDTDILHHRPHSVNETGQVIGFAPFSGDTLDSGDVVPILLRKGFYNCPPTVGLSYSRRMLDKIMPIPEEWSLCADAYIFITSAFLSPVAAMEESVAFYRLHGSNNFGLPVARRLLTRDKVERYSRNEVLRLALIKQQAAERGLPVPRFPPNSFCFDELLLYRSAPSAYDVKKGAELYGNLLKYLWSESGGTWRFILQKTVAGLIIFLGPRPLLRIIYPRIFADEA